MNYIPHTITLPMELAVTARRMESGDCEIENITMNGRGYCPHAIFTEQQLRDLRAAWLDAEEAAESHARAANRMP